MRAVPWVCGKCGHVNKGKRSTCIECGADRPRRLVRKVREG